MSSRVVGRSIDSSHRPRLSAVMFLRRIVVVVLTATAVLASAGTTFAGAPSYACDARVIARDDAEAFGSYEASSGQVIDARDECASPAIEARVASTTPFARSVATNTVTTPIESGNYVVSTPVGEYVGQSGNISTRLEQHVASGKFTQAEVDAAQRFAVPERSSTAKSPSNCSSIRRAASTTY